MTVHIITETFLNSVLDSEDHIIDYRVMSVFQDHEEAEEELERLNKQNKSLNRKYLLWSKDVF